MLEYALVFAIVGGAVGKVMHSLWQMIFTDKTGGCGCASASSCMKVGALPAEKSESQAFDV